MRSLLRTVGRALGQARPGPGVLAGLPQQPALVRRLFSAHNYR